jgi:hypothetical protein
MILLLDLALLALIPVFVFVLIIALFNSVIGIIQIVLGLILLACSYLIDAILWAFKALTSFSPQHA